MKAAIIRQFLADVNWGELDYLIIDSPPGTGDEPLSACQLIPNVTGAVIVTTPQDVAVLDARKSVQFAKALKIPVVGIIENMSGFICPHCHTEIDIFKKGGGEKAAEELKISFLGRVPFQLEFVEYADKGTPFVSFKEKSTLRLPRPLGRGSLRVDTEPCCLPLPERAGSGSVEVSKSAEAFMGIVDKIKEFIGDK